MYYLCEKHHKPIVVQQCIASCVSWVPKLTFLNLQTHWIYECTMEWNSFLCWEGGGYCKPDGTLTSNLSGSRIVRKCVYLKSRDISFSTKVHLVKTVVFPVVMYGCESWTIKKAEHQRTDAFELQCQRRLKSPLDCKEIQSVQPKGNQS